MNDCSALQSLWNTDVVSTVSHPGCPSTSSLVLLTWSHHLQGTLAEKLSASTQRGQRLIPSRDTGVADQAVAQCCSVLF